VRGVASDGRPGWHVGPRVSHGLRVTGGPEAEMDFGFSFNPIFHKHRNDSLAGKKLLGVSKKSENFPGVRLFGATFVIGTYPDLNGFLMKNEIQF
jgi:hypothetical protein